MSPASIAASTVSAKCPVVEPPEVIAAILDKSCPAGAYLSLLHGGEIFSGSSVISNSVYYSAGRPRNDSSREKQLMTPHSYIKQSSKRNLRPLQRLLLIKSRFLYKKASLATRLKVEQELINLRTSKLRIVCF